MEKTSTTIRGDRLMLALEHLFFMGCVQDRSENGLFDPKSTAGYVFSERIRDLLDQRTREPHDCWFWYKHASIDIGRGAFKGRRVLSEPENVLFNIEPTVDLFEDWRHSLDHLTGRECVLMKRKIVRLLCMVASGEISEETIRRGAH